MGVSGWQLLILLLVVVLVFGTRRLRNIGGDLGSAVKGFRKGMEDDDGDDTTERRAELGSGGAESDVETATRDSAEHKS